MWRRQHQRYPDCRRGFASALSNRLSWSSDLASPNVSTLDFFWLDMTEEPKQNRLVLYGKFKTASSSSTAPQFATGIISIENCYKTLKETLRSVLDCHHVLMCDEGGAREQV